MKLGTVLLILVASLSIIMTNSGCSGELNTQLGATTISTGEGEGAEVPVDPPQIRKEFVPGCPDSGSNLGGRTLNYLPDSQLVAIINPEDIMGSPELLNLLDVAENRMKREEVSKMEIIMEMAALSNEMAVAINFRPDEEIRIDSYVVLASAISNEDRSYLMDILSDKLFETDVSFAGVDKLVAVGSAGLVDTVIQRVEYDSDAAAFTTSMQDVLNMTNVGSIKIAMHGDLSGEISRRLSGMLIEVPENAGGVIGIDAKSWCIEGIGVADGTEVVRNITKINPDFISNINFEGFVDLIESTRENLRVHDNEYSEEREAPQGTRDIYYETRETERVIDGTEDGFERQ